MTKPIPTVQKYMTVTPHTIGADQTLAHARQRMDELRVRHLPVMSGEKLVGVVTDRDLHLIESLKDVDPRLVTVFDAMSGSVYTVSPDAPLDDVAGTMAEKKVGSAVVIQNGKVVGIFTTVDVCLALTDLLHSRLAK
jgi:acetoin utilization protein AcuB